MQRKKISTGTNNAAAIVELDDDEQLVEEVTTTKRIGRQRRQPPPAAEDIVTVEPDDDDDETEIDAAPSYSDTSLAALLYGDGDEPLESQFCTVMIRRNPDSMNDKFLTPCGALTSLPPLRNIELTAERIDIEERVRTEFGGGHYFFQIHFGNQLRSSWKATLSDDPAAVRAAKAERLGLNQPPPAAPAPAAPAADPMDSFIASLKQTAELKNLLFGDTEKQLRDEIARLRTEAETAKAAIPPPVEKSEKLTLLEMAFETNKPEVTDRILNSIFPSEEEGQRSTIAELASLALEHKDTLIGLVGSLFGGLMPQPAVQPSIADLMRQPAPAGLPPRKSAFSRNRTEPAAAEPAPAETPPPAEAETEPAANAPDDLTKGDETAIDAEITNEVKNAKPKRTAA